MSWDRDVHFYTQSAETEKKAKERLEKFKKTVTQGPFSEMVLIKLIESNEKMIDHCKNMREYVRKRWPLYGAAAAAFNQIDGEYGL